jgi:acyl homoserine lactone synthase
MIKIVRAADLFRRPLLAASMFRDRAIQFRDRLGWDVALDDQGLEFDAYDDLNPVYVIMHDEQGEHLGSGRLLPTTGRTMLGEHFPDLTDGVTISSSLIWETTRFCVSPRVRADRSLALRTPAALLWAGCEIARRSGVEFYVGVFNASMLKVYQRAGWTPEVLGSRKTDEGEICAGLWEVSQEVQDTLADRAGPDLIGVQYYPDANRFPAAEIKSLSTDMATVSELARLM